MMQVPVPAARNLRSTRELNPGCQLPTFGHTTRKGKMNVRDQNTLAMMTTGGYQLDLLVFWRHCFRETTLSETDSRLEGMRKTVYPQQLHAQNGSFERVVFNKLP